VPGACSGKITFKGEAGKQTNFPMYPRGNTTTNIVLYGDNINKIPKELADVGPTEEIYGSETLLYPRVVTKYIVDITNVTPYKPVLSSTESSQVRELNEFTVSSIMSFNDLGVWTLDRSKKPADSSYPHDGTNYIDPLYLEASHNPFVAQLATNFLVGFAPTVQDQPYNSPTPPNFSKNLNVYETDPVVSKIDIYWESSSSDRISVLNNEIKTDTAGQPSGISEPNLVMLESLTPGVSSWISDPFEVIDGTGIVVPDATATMTVTNGNNAAVSMFEILKPDPLGQEYRIRYNPTDANIYYGADSSVRTFNFNITGTATSGESNTSTHQMLLSNVEPTFTVPNNGVGLKEYLHIGETGFPSGEGSLSSPFPIFTFNPSASNPQPGSSLGTVNKITEIFNGSGSTNTNTTSAETDIKKSGTVNSQTLFEIDNTSSSIEFKVVNDPVYIEFLKQVDDGNGPGIFLFKVYVQDAGLIGAQTFYSGYFEVQ